MKSTRTKLQVEAVRLQRAMRETINATRHREMGI